MKVFFLKLIDRWQQHIKRKYLSKNLHALKAKEFTIVSSNCWGGIVYRDLGLNYQTPFVNMYLHTPCFMKLILDFSSYMKQELIVSASSSYFNHEASYPVGHLGDIEIHFIHYTMSDPVVEKWNERKSRIQTDRLLFVLSERDLCTEADLRKFDQLPFRKIAFTAHDYGLKNGFKIFSIGGEALSADLMMGFSYVKTDIIQYLNRMFPQER